MLKNKLSSLWPLLFTFFTISFNAHDSFAQVNKPLENLAQSLSTLSQNLKSLKTSLMALNKPHFSQLEILIRDMKHYKAQSTDFHSGHLYEHSIWVACAIEKWFDENHEWTEGLSTRDREITILAALLHDVGKASCAPDTYKFSQAPEWYHTTKPHLTHYPDYHTISEHPKYGFEILIGVKDYKLTAAENKSITKDQYGNNDTFDFKKLYEELKLTENEQAAIAIMAAIHYAFGFDVLRKGTSEEAIESYLNNIKKLVKKTNYNNQIIDEKIVKLSILIGAADIKGSQEVDYFDALKKYSWFTTRTFTKPKNHGKYKPLPSYFIKDYPDISRYDYYYIYMQRKFAKPEITPHYPGTDDEAINKRTRVLEYFKTKYQPNK